MKQQQLFSVFVLTTFLGCGHASGVATEDASKGKDALLGSFSIPKNGDAIVLPLTIAGTHTLFDVDTGATFSLFDDSLQKLLKAHVATQTVDTDNGTIALEIYEPPPVQLGQSVLQMDGPIGCMELSMLREVHGRDSRGVLGMDCLKHYVMQCDFDAGKLTIWNSSKQPESDWGTAVPLFDRDDEVPNGLFVSIVVDRNPMLFLLDTDSDHIGLKSDVIQSLRRNGQLGTIANHGRARTIGGEQTELKDYVVRTLALGPFQHRNLHCTESKHNSISLSYLSRYRATFDFPRRTMYLNKGRRYDAADHEGMSGLQLSWKDGGVVVRNVDANRPGASAGITPGDRILRVDNLNVASLSGMTDKTETVGERSKTGTTERGGTTSFVMVAEDWT